ncbi:MAG TPA: gamma-glutamyltransferase [Gaiellaceae bacterium]|nr:gamma-glutamyltransferase [Gaiellaceae bacterium]
MISAPRIEAIEAGEQVLRDGGTATDAAVAACFVLGVVEPYMTGLGAVGELVHLDADGSCTVVDAAARAPLAATPDLFGEPVDGPPGGYGWPAVAGRRNEVGGSAVCAPRLVSGLVEAHRRFGRLPWARLLEPAIRLAEEGWVLDHFTEACVFAARADLEAHSDGLVDTTYPPATRPFGLDGTPRRLRNPALAESLRLVAREGEDALRRGPLADAIVAVARRDGGVLAAADLEAADAPVHEHVEPLGSYRGWAVHGSPAPSGGITAAQILARLDASPPRAVADPERYAEVASASAAVFTHRLERLAGDLEPGKALTATTHLSAADSEGRVVSLTSTLLSLFGSTAAVAGHGFYLNNGMMWFDPRPGRSASIRPGARSLSAVSPLVLVDPAGTTRIALGALGGRRIISAVAQIAALRIDDGLPLAEAVDVPRVHVEPTFCHVDERLPAAVHDALRARGFEPVSLAYAPATLAFARANGVEWGPSGTATGIDRRSRDTWRYGA